MKAVFGAVLLAAALPASADELVVGALRDQDGAVVAGARLAALASSGAVLGRDRSGPDGTFALSVPERPAFVRVETDDAQPLRLTVPPAGPVIGLVRRHRSADHVPTAADIAALPGGSLGEVATVVPYWVAFPGETSDRWLARGAGATTIEGLSFYRRGDGRDATSLIPSHAIGSIGLGDPLFGARYGDRGGGGSLDGRIFDRQDGVRGTDRDASILAGSDPLGFAATSWDPDGTRHLVAERDDTVFGPVAATVVALAGDAPTAHYAGLGATMRGGTRLIDLAATLGLTRNTADGIGIDAGNVTSFTLEGAGRGPNALDVRARWRDERGVIGDDNVDHRDGALIVGTTRGGASLPRVTASLALEYGSELAPDGTRLHGLALAPSLAVNTPLSSTWSFHAGLGDSTLGTPGVALARAHLGEAGFAYDNHRRLNFSILAYAEGDGAPVAFTRGFAGSLGWEIAPRLSLRAWSLRDGDAQQELVPEYPGGPLRAITGATTFQRDLIWLTWDGPSRIDLLLRAGSLEGNVRFPLGRRYAITAGSARRLIDAKRVFSIGLVGH